jgi:anti-sigma-K factor RskA
MSDLGSTHPEMTHDEVSELAGLYVLGALEPDEHAAVVAHLATCSEAHEEIRELGGVVPALASLAEPLDAPADLKRRVLAAVAADAARGTATQPIANADVLAAKRPGRYSTADGLNRRPVTPAPAAWQVPAWASWVTAVAAVLVLALVGVWALGLQSRAAEADRRAAVLSEAIAAFSEPGSSVAILRDTTPSSNASGLAAISADGSAYLVMVGLPSAPAGQTYQAWYIADAAPVSAGLMTVDSDGFAVFKDAQAMAGTKVVALTLEPAGGSDQPTSDPFVVGTLHPA